MVPMPTPMLRSCANRSAPGPFVRQFHCRIAGKITEDLIGHVSACSALGDSQLRSDCCDSLSYELSNWGSPDYELEMTELVGERVDKGFD